MLDYQRMESHRKDTKEIRHIILYETPCNIKEEDMELLRETEKRGFIQIRNK